MKVPPKRKGNVKAKRGYFLEAPPSMKVPPKRKGNCRRQFRAGQRPDPLNESPSEKEGKFVSVRMEAPTAPETLNESPSEKEGKFQQFASSVPSKGPQ